MKPERERIEEQPHLVYHGSISDDEFAVYSVSAAPYSGYSVEEVVAHLQEYRFFCCTEQTLRDTFKLVRGNSEVDDDYFFLVHQGEEVMSAGPIALYTDAGGEMVRVCVDMKQKMSGRHRYVILSNCVT